jgi:hypothetical protein
MVRKAESGYILILTTFIVATSILLISFVVSRVATYRQLTKISAEKESARLIARSGIDIAMSQLMIFAQKQEQQQAKKQDAKKPDQTKQDQSKETEEGDEKSKADFVLKTLNKWQSFDLTEKHESMDATCEIYITSEQGKININNLYDFGQKQFKVLGTTDGKKVLEFIADRLKPTFESQGKKIDLLHLIEQALREHGGPLDDISQILTPQDSEILQERLFPSKDQKDRITLFDIFTTAKTQGLHPLAVTPSTKLLIGLKTPGKDAKEKPSNGQIDNILNKQIRDWKREWEPTLAALYGTNYASIPEPIKSLFANKFETNLFFVVSYGKVGSITEKVAALIEKNQTGTTKEKPFIIRKLYWL